jgi:hypothetical protein
MWQRGSGCVYRMAVSLLLLSLDSGTSDAEEFKGCNGGYST